MSEERAVKKIYKWKLTASRPVGRPNIRWMDNAMKGIQAMKPVNWKGVHRIELNGNKLLIRPELI
jgi:hypothetical protein